MKKKTMIIRPAKRTESVQEYYFSRKLKEIALMNVERAASGEEPVQRTFALCGPG